MVIVKGECFQMGDIFGDGRGGADVGVGGGDGVGDSIVVLCLHSQYPFLLCSCDPVHWLMRWPWSLLDVDDG